MYTFTWTDVAAGNYTVTAKATDNQGATAVSPDAEEVSFLAAKEAAALTRL